MFLRAGWEIVEDDISNTYSGAGREVEGQRSSQVWRTVNKDPNASSRDGVLMRIPKHLYQEDQALKDAYQDKKIADVDKTGDIRKALASQARKY